MRIPALLALLLLLGAGCSSKEPSVPVAKRPPATRPVEAIYIVDGMPFELDVRYDVPVEGESASSVTTSLFGEPVEADLDADGDMDAVVMLHRETAGSGSFFFVAAAINEEGVYRGTEAYPIGDRIAPQTLEFRDGLVIANYAERKPDEPMTAEPTVGASAYFRYEGGNLQKVEPPTAAP